MEKIKTYIRRTILATGAFFALTLFLTPALAGISFAQNNKAAGIGDAACKNVTTTAKVNSCLENSAVAKQIRLIVNALSAGVGVVVVAMIIVGGIQYIMAGDNPNAIEAAKHRITNALLALLAFLLVGAFLQWLIPGGVFD